MGVWSFGIKIISHQAVIYYRPLSITVKCSESDQMCFLPTLLINRHDGFSPHMPCITKLRPILRADWPIGLGETRPNHMSNIWWLYSTLCHLAMHVPLMAHLGTRSGALQVCILAVPPHNNVVCIYLYIFVCNFKAGISVN